MQEKSKCFLTLSCATPNISALLIDRYCINLELTLRFLGIEFRFSRFFSFCFIIIEKKREIYFNVNNQAINSCRKRKNCRHISVASGNQQKKEKCRRRFVHIVSCPSNVQRLVNIAHTYVCKRQQRRSQMMQRVFKDLFER